MTCVEDSVVGVQTELETALSDIKVKDTLIANLQEKLKKSDEEKEEAFKQLKEAKKTNVQLVSLLEVQFSRNQYPYVKLNRVELNGKTDWHSRVNFLFQIKIRRKKRFQIGKLDINLLQLEAVL